MTFVRNTNQEHQESLSPLEKLALFVTQKIGSMGFFAIIVIWTMGWIFWNTFGPHDLRFDPFPSFFLWLFVSNAIQLFFLPLIMVGQNLQGRHSELRGEADYAVNVRAEKEIKRILTHLEKQDKISIETLRRIDELALK